MRYRLLGKSGVRISEVAASDESHTWSPRTSRTTAESVPSEVDRRSGRRENRHWVHEIPDPPPRYTGPAASDHSERMF
jgi:hypothetical protein